MKAEELSASWRSPQALATHVALPVVAPGTWTFQFEVLDVRAEAPPGFAVSAVSYYLK